MLNPRPSLVDPGGLRGLVQNVRYGLYVATPEGEVLDANPAFLRILGLTSPDELGGRSLEEFLADPPARRRELANLTKPGSACEFEVEIRGDDGVERTALETTYLFRDADASQLLHHGILIDITERKRLEKLLMEQSHRDPLTGCWNRRFLTEAAERLEPRPAPWGVILIDVDRFKDYNDQFGHAAGDEVLVKLSRFLMRRTRAEERVLRLGGDEFLLLLEGADDATTECVADRLRIAAASEHVAPFSLGFAGRRPGEPLEETIARADAKLLAVKSAERAPRRREREPAR